MKKNKAKQIDTSTTITNQPTTGKSKLIKKLCKKHGLPYISHPPIK